jgi:hypothetical protein
MIEEIKLLFLTSQCFEQGKAIRGGALVTDGKTRPIEFRCTSPIRPNNYQKVLYGSTLDSYIFVDLIGIPLVNKTQENINLVLVEDDRFLPMRPHIDVTVTRLQQSSRQEGSPFLSLKLHPKFKNEKKFAESSLKPLFEQGIDLMEPFERVQLALEQAHARKVGDKNRSE